MADNVFPEVTLAHADHALLQCWKEKVSKGFECSLILKHSKGKVTTILTSRSSRLPEPGNQKTASKTPAGDNKRKKGHSKKRLEALLSFQKRLVEEKGLPPSRLMLEQAAAAPPSPLPAESVALEEPSPTVETLSKCELCNYESTSKHGLSVHIGRTHKKTKKSQLLFDKSFKCPSCLKLFVSEHNLYFHIYGYGGPDVKPNCVGMATVKCHICKQSESCCQDMVRHVKKEHNRSASVLRRFDGKDHFVYVGADEVQCNGGCS